MGHQLLGKDPVAHPPAGHCVTLGKAVQDDGPFLHSGNGRDAVVVTRVEYVFIDLVGHHVQPWVLHHDPRDLFQFFLGQGRATGVLRRVDNHQPCFIRNQAGQGINVRVVARFFHELHSHGCSAGELDHGFIDRESGVGVNDFDTGLSQRQKHVKHDGFCARRHYNVSRVGVRAPDFTAIPGDGLAKFRQPGRGGVMGETIADSLHARLYDMPGRLEVGLADLKVDYLFALGFQGAGPGQHLKRRLSAQVVHTGSNCHRSSGIMGLQNWQGVCGNAPGTQSDWTWFSVRTERPKILMNPSAELWSNSSARS